MLAQMTQLRGEESVGILDLMLVAGALVSAVSNFIRPKSLINDNIIDQDSFSLKIYFQNPVFLYGIWSLLAIIVSITINSQNGPYSLDYFYLPSLPYVATALVILSLVIVLESENGGALLSGFAVVSLLVGIFYTFGAITQNAAMMYEDRFSGFCINPNQIALQALATLLALAMIVIHTRSNMTFYVAIAATPFVLAYGLASKSDALVISLPLVTAVFGLIILKRYQIKLWIVVAAGIFLVVAFLLGLAAAFPSIFGGVGEIVQGQLQQGGQDTDRALLWRHGWLAWSHSPIFGNGPGAWSGVGAPFQGVEAHNSVIDWLTISGIFGSLPLALILLRALRKFDDIRLIRVCGFAGLVLFTTFHFVFRLPIFWFSILLILMPYYTQWRNAAESDMPQP